MFELELQQYLQRQSPPHIKRVCLLRIEEINKLKDLFNPYET